MAKGSTETLLLEGTYWQFLDAAKDLLTADRWQGAVMDCSKNEQLALVHVYREGESTMSRIAEYVGVPLNTATGIATRLERRGLVERWRSESDKRVVSVRITNLGKEQVTELIRLIGSLLEGIIGDLDEDELRVLVKCIGRLPDLLAKQIDAVADEDAPRRQVRRIAID